MTSQPSSSCPLVAIAGAGPAGLSLAYLLNIYHQSFVIIDPKMERDHASKATGLHRNTLRLFGKVGLADEIARQAIELNANKIYVDGSLVKTIAFEQGCQVNDKNLSIDQCSLETILFSHLPPASILLGRKIIAFHQDEAGVVTEVQNCLTHQIERIKTKYLVGADGAGSFVRKSLGYSFDGVTTPEVAFTFDAIPRTPAACNEMAIFTMGEERLVVFRYLGAGPNFLDVLMRLFLQKINLLSVLLRCEIN